MSENCHVVKIIVLERHVGGQRAFAEGLGKY